MARTGQDITRKAPLGKRIIGLRLVAAAGVLLALDLLFLPWHHFSFDLGQFADELGDLSVDRTAVQSPNAGLGIAAVVGALALAAYALVEWVRQSRPSPPAAAGTGADRLPLIAGPAVFALLLLKAVVEPNFLGVGMWLGLLLAAGLAYGGFVLGQARLLAAADRLRPGHGPSGGGRGLTQQQRWLLLGTAIVVGSLIAVVLQGQSDNELVAPSVPELSIDSTPAPTEDTAPPSEVTPDTTTAETPVEEATEPSPAATPAPGEQGTTVEPGLGETGGSVTVTGQGAEPGNAYVVKLHRVADSCVAAGIPLGAARTADDEGTVGPVRAFIPTNVTSGRYFICFADDADSTRGLPPAELIVS